MKYVGKDVIGSDVIIPGATVTMRDPDSRLEPLMPPLQTGNLLNAMMEVEKSIDQTANTQAAPQTRPQGVTAYEMSLREKQMQQDLGPFWSELIGASVQVTRLVMGDVLQHMTVADVSKMQGAKAGLKYKSFLVELKGGEGKASKRRIKFEKLPEFESEEEKMSASYDLLEEQGGIDAETEIVKADPTRIRKLKYSMVMTDDVLQPKSEAVRYQQNLEMLDQIIKTETVRPGLNDMETVVKKLLYSTNPVTARDPDSFISKQQPGTQTVGLTPESFMAMASRAKQPAPAVQPAPMV
jgi:hypothetical protein